MGLRRWLAGNGIGQWIAGAAVILAVLFVLGFASTAAFDDKTGLFCQWIKLGGKLYKVCY